MIVGQIIFGREIALAPQGTIDANTRDIALGVWKTLGLEVLVEPLELPESCLDVEEMRRRNALVARRRRTLCS